MRRLLSATLLSFFAVALGCSPVSSSGGDQPELLPPIVDGPSDPVASIKTGDPLYFNLGIQWENATSKSYDNVKTCSIPENAPIGTSIMCNISIPEARLYYSKLNFRMGSKNATACPILRFQPYFYVRSFVDYTPAGAKDPITCSTEMTAGCFGGSAPVIISDFPKNFGRYFVPVITAEQSFLLPSENSTRWYHGYPVNYLVTNDDLAPTVAHNVGPAKREANSWVDHSVSCVDNWGATLYTINIMIADENTADSLNGPVDHYPDWP